MIIVKEPLFILIKSLSRSEKRYFKLYCSIQHKEGADEEMNYLKLFEFLDGSEEYNEKKLLDHFSGERFIQQLHVAKNYLYHLILRSLRGFFHEALPELEFSNQLQNVEILYNKGLFKQCLKQLAKVEKLAEETEDHIRLMQVYRMRLHLMQRHDTDKSPEKIRKNWELLHRESERYLNFITIRKYAIEIYNLIGQGGIERSKTNQHLVDRIMKRLKDEKLNEKNISYRAKQNLLNIDLAYYAFKGDEKREIATLERSRKHHEARPATIVSKPGMYATCLSNLAIGYSKYGYYEKALGCYYAIRNMVRTYKIKKTRQLETVLFNDAANTLLELLNKQRLVSIEGTENELAGIVSEAVRNKEFSVYIEHQRLNFNLANYHFIHREFKTANKFINLFLDNWKEGQRDDLFAACSFMQLAIFYLNKETELISYALPRLRRKLQKLEALHDTEKNVLEFFKKIIDEDNEKKIHGLFDKIIRKVQNEKKGRSSWMENFDFSWWLKKAGRQGKG